MSFFVDPDREQSLLLDALFAPQWDPHTLERCEPVRLVALADRQRVTGVLARRFLQLSASGSEFASAYVGPVARQLADTLAVRRDTALDAFLRQMCTYVDVREALDAVGSRHLVLKGPTLTRLYDTEFERHAGDLDVLIDSPAHADAVVEELSSRGWRAPGEWSARSAAQRRRWIAAHKDLVLDKPGDRVTLELHWRASDSVLEWPGAADVFADARTVRVGGQEVPALAERHEALYLLHHGAKHGWRRLKWFVDMQRLDRGGRAGAGYREALTEFGLHAADGLLETMLRTVDGHPTKIGPRRRLELGLVNLSLEQPELREIGTTRDRLREKLLRSIAGVALAPRPWIAAVKIAKSAAAMATARGHDRRW